MFASPETVDGKVRACALLLRHPSPPGPGSLSPVRAR
jgi:hypothetical protein